MLDKNFYKIVVVMVAILAISQLGLWDEIASVVKFLLKSIGILIVLMLVIFLIRRKIRKLFAIGA